MGCWSLDFKLILKVVSWNVLGRKEDVTDLDFTRSSMLTGWDTTKIRLNGVHEQFTPRKLRCPARSRSQRWADKWKLLESGLTDCSPRGMVRQLRATLGGGTWRGVASTSVERRRVVVGFDGFGGVNGVDGSDGDDGTDRFVDFDDFDGSTRRH